jgi:hypothetical protein
MSHHRGLATAAILTLLAIGAAPATGKGLGTMTVCAADGCKRVDETTARRFEQLGGFEVLRMYKAPRPAPFVRVVIGIDEGGRSAGSWENVVIPATGAEHNVGGDGGWVQLPPPAEQALRDILGDRPPLPARRLNSAIRSATTGSDNGVLPPEVYVPRAPGAATHQAGHTGGSSPGLWVGGGAAALLLLLAGIRASGRRRAKLTPPAGIGDSGS